MVNLINIGMKSEEFDYKYLYFQLYIDFRFQPPIVHHFACMYLRLRKRERKSCIDGEVGQILSLSSELRWLLLKVSKSQNKIMNSSFLPKYERNVLWISASKKWLNQKLYYTNYVNLSLEARAKVLEKCRGFFGRFENTKRTFLN